jgi:ribonuclease G
LKSEIVINTGIHETRIAIIEDSKLVEVWVESPDNERMVGDIYKGTANAVIPGIQASFVDIGMEKSAFLHASDVSGYSIDFAAQYDTDDDDDDDDDDEKVSDKKKSSHPKKGRDKRGRSGRSPEKRYPPIESIIKKGQEIIVQITKEPISTKGARVTSEISLPGRFLVLVPGGSKIGVSRKIESRKEAKRLKQIAKKYKPAGYGLIIRTVAEGKGENEVEAEINNLLGAYQELMKKADSLPTPSLVHKEMGMTSGIIRDILSEDIDSVEVDTKEHYNDIRKYLKNTSPALMKKVKLFKEKEPIFDHYKIEKEIDTIFNRKTWMKKGGSLVFDHAEALTVIDVNSGKFLGKSNQVETILETNIEAAREIARQLRLRDIGGIIVIDFIDMYDMKNRRKVEDIFADALRNDRSRVSISQISEFGLMEMTRQRVRPSLVQAFAEPCPTCEGIGMVQGRETTVSKIERWLKRAESFGKEKSYTIFVHPGVFAFLFDNGEEKLSMLKSSTKLSIDIVVDAKIAISEFYCFSSTRNVDVTDEFIPVKKGQPGKSYKSKAKPKTNVKSPEPKRSFTRPTSKPKTNGTGNSPEPKESISQATSKPKTNGIGSSPEPKESISQEKEVKSESSFGRKPRQKTRR